MYKSDKKCICTHSCTFHLSQVLEQRSLKVQCFYLACVWQKMRPHGPQYLKSNNLHMLQYCIQSFGRCGTQHSHMSLPCGSLHRTRKNQVLLSHLKFWIWQSEKSKQHIVFLKVQNAWKTYKLCKLISKFQKLNSRKTISRTVFKVDL